MSRIALIDIHGYEFDESPEKYLDRIKMVMEMAN